MDGFRGSLEHGSVTEGEYEALLNNFDRYEISLMDEDHMYCDQSSTVEVARYSSSEGVSL